MSKADIEMRWINAWNEMYEIIGEREDFPCGQRSAHKLRSFDLPGSFGRVRLTRQPKHEASVHANEQ